MADSFLVLCTNSKPSNYYYLLYTMYLDLQESAANHGVVELLRNLALKTAKHKG